MNNAASEVVVRASSLQFGVPEVQNAQAGRPRHKARGLTLIEILTAMFVLMIGIIGILSIIMRSSQMGTSATDRNNASVLLPEAIADIERMHLITKDMAQANGLNDAYVDLLFETIGLNKPDVPHYGTITLPCSNGPNGAVTMFTMKNIAYPAGDANSSLAYWPMNPYYSRVMGQFPQAGGDLRLNKSGAAYRALYKLEMHPDWVIDRPFNLLDNADSAFAGVYVLTIAMYKDLEPGKPTTDPTKKLQQITDPVVRYLRDKKVRH